MAQVEVSEWFRNAGRAVAEGDLVALHVHSVVIPGTPDRQIVDIFRVEGGQLHDWFHHGVGEKPVFSIPMENKTGFAPALYVMRGEPQAP